MKLVLLLRRELLQGMMLLLRRMKGLSVRLVELRNCRIQIPNMGILGVHGFVFIVRVYIIMLPFY